MLYTGIDYHKKYSVASTFDASGTRIREARIDDNEPAAFAAYFRSLPESSAVVMEACWNWGWLYDELHEIERVESGDRGPIRRAQVGRSDGVRPLIVNNRLGRDNLVKDRPVFLRSAAIGTGSGGLLFNRSCLIDPFSGRGRPKGGT